MSRRFLTFIHLDWIFNPYHPLAELVAQHQNEHNDLFQTQKSNPLLKELQPTSLDNIRMSLPKDKINFNSFEDDPNPIIVSTKAK